MIARIPILNGAREIVAYYDFDGGKWKLVASAARYNDTLPAIRQAIDGGSNLSLVRYRTDTWYVRGWQGMWGTLNALDAVLPPIGLWVDWNHVQFPEKG